MTAADSIYFHLMLATRPKTALTFWNLNKITIEESLVYDCFFLWDWRMWRLEV